MPLYFFKGIYDDKIRLLETVKREGNFYLSNSFVDIVPLPSYIKEKVSAGIHPILQYLPA